MTEQSNPDETMKDAPQAAKKGKMSDRTLMIIAGIVVLILLLAVVAYSQLGKDEDEETNGLEVTVHPDLVGADPAKAYAVWANATYESESIDNSTAAQFSWSVDNPALGSFVSEHDRVTTFTTNKSAGEGNITVSVAYLAEGEVLYANVTVELSVKAPVLADLVLVPPSITLIYDRPTTFNVTAHDSVGDQILGLAFAWTVEGMPVDNVSLSAISGPSVNVTANASGFIWVNVTATEGSVTVNASAYVHVIPAWPTMNIARTNLPGGIGVNWTCDEPTSDLAWEDVIVYLTDGTDTVSWSLSTANLNDGAANTSEFGPATIGTLTVFLNVTDMQGNGAVNATDYFHFTTSGGKFNPARNYVVTMVYKPTLDVIATAPFRG